MTLTNPQLIAAIAKLEPAHVAGVFQRHTAPDVVEPVGWPSGGRWGAPNAFAVLYLGRPTDSVIVEAYRHLVEDDYDNEHELTGDMVGPRNLLTCRVDVTEILDLRFADHQAAVGLSEQALRSGIDEYAACRRVGHAAHQLGLHGIMAPTATGLGETLALFDEKLPTTELPQLEGEIERWAHLPPDPRRLRALRSA